MEEGQDAVSWKLDQCRGGVASGFHCFKTHFELE